MLATTNGEGGTNLTANGNYVFQLTSLANDGIVIQNRNASSDLKITVNSVYEV